MEWRLYLGHGGPRILGPQKPFSWLTRQWFYIRRGKPRDPRLTPSQPKGPAPKEKLSLREKLVIVLIPNSRALFQISDLGTEEGRKNDVSQSLPKGTYYIFNSEVN